MKPKRRRSKISINALHADLRKMLNRSDEFYELLRRDRLECNLIIENHIKINEALRVELRKAEQMISDTLRRNTVLTAQLADLKRQRRRRKK